MLVSVDLEIQVHAGPCVEEAITFLAAAFLSSCSNGASDRDET